MEHSPLELPEARRYQDAMRRFGAVIRKARSEQLAGFLIALDAALAGLYQAGSELPDLAPDTADLPEKGPARDDYGALQATLASLLGRFDQYHDIYNPTDPNDQEPVQYLLSLDLVEILEDQDYAESLLDPGRHVSPADIVWQWRFDFTSHWGSHVVGALRVVNCLLYTEFVATLDDRTADA